MRFTERETGYLLQQRLGRLATVSPTRQPHVVPVAYAFDGAYFYFSGWNLAKSLKFRNLRQNPQVGLVVDDVARTDRWAPRGVEIRGLAEPIEKEGRLYVRITPLRKVSWGLGGGARR
jgi:pyridoxamine 5'-phosphate oxidase family protein